MATTMAAMGRHVAPPPPVRAALERFFGGAVDHVRVIEHSWFAWLHMRAVATTRRRRIYLRGSAEHFYKDPALMLHEYCHVIYQWEPGLLTTWGYVSEWLRRGYWDNRFEIEAREYAADNLYRFRALLTRNDATGRWPQSRPGGPTPRDSRDDRGGPR